MDVLERRRPGPAPAVMSGPLAAYESALRTELTRLGYAASSVRDTTRAMARLSCWMQDRALTAAELTPRAVDEFRAVRRQRCRSEHVARNGLGTVLRILRGHGLVPGGERAATTAVEELLADYRTWLGAERGLADKSVRCYASHAQKFLATLADPVGESLARLDAAAVTTFMVGQSTMAGSVWSAKALTTAMRCLLRFLYLQGLTAAPLMAAVPHVAGWRLASLPRGLEREQVQALLATPDTTTAVGLRDHAVLTVLAGLGLRGAEVAALGLADVDWHAAEIMVRGKGSRVERLPLFADVGQALAAYLTNGRPTCRCPSLFVTARVPYRPLSSSAVRAIVARACQQAGLPRIGAHRLRHTLATDMLRAGAGLAEIGQVLRHRSQLSTAIYAKVDHEALRTLARPWPGGAR